MTHVELYREQQLLPEFRNRNWNMSSDEPGYVSFDGTLYHESQISEPGDYRWRVKHTNDKIVGASAEGYVKRQDMIHNLCFLTGGEIKRRNGALLLRRRTSLSGRWMSWEIEDLTGDKR